VIKLGNILLVNWQLQSVSRNWTTFLVQFAYGGLLEPIYATAPIARRQQKNNNFDY